MASGRGGRWNGPPESSEGGSTNSVPQPEQETASYAQCWPQYEQVFMVGEWRTANIEGFIGTDDGGGLLPPLTAGQPFWLIVSEVHKEAAEQILDEFENGTAPLVEQPPSLKPTEPAKPL